MPTPDHDPALELLSEDQCRRYLGAATLGRLGFTRDALPAIQPVSFRLAGREVVIPVRADSALLRGTRGTIVVVEADEYDEYDRTGWSVSVVGPARLVRDPAEVAACEALRWPPTTGGPDRRYLTVRTALVQGWRTRPGAERGRSPVPSGRS